MFRLFIKIFFVLLIMLSLYLFVDAWFHCYLFPKYIPDIEHISTVENLMENKTFWEELFGNCQKLNQTKN